MTSGQKFILLAGIERLAARDQMVAAEVQSDWMAMKDAAMRFFMDDEDADEAVRVAALRKLYQKIEETGQVVQSAFVSDEVA